MLRLLPLLLLAAAPLRLAAEDVIPADEGGFTDHMAQRIRQRLPDQPVSVKSPLTLSVGPLQANLDRIFGFCRTGAAGCAAEVAQYVEGVAEAVQRRGAPADRGSIRLVVRDAEYMKSAQQGRRERFGKEAPRMLVRPFVDGFSVVAIADSPRAMAYLDERILAQLRLGEEELFALARANVGKELKPLLEVARAVAPGQIGSIGGGVYEVSRVALHDQWAALAAAQGGRLIVALPATDLVLYASEDGPIPVDALRTLAKELRSKASAPLSAEVLRWTPEGWARVR